MEPNLPFIQQNPSQATSGGGIDIWHYAQVLFRRKWSILFLGILFAAWAGLATMSQKPIYTATLTMVLEDDQSPMMAMQDIYRSFSSGYEYVETEYAILRSRHLAEKVVRKAELHKHPYFNRPPAPESKFDLNFFRPKSSDPKPVKKLTDEQRIKGLIGFVAGGVRVSEDYDRLIQLSFVSRDADLAVLVVNTLAEVYIEDHLQAELEATQKATEWLSTRLQELKVNLNDSEARLQDFREAEQLIQINGGVISINAREMDELSSRLSQARSKRAAAESIFRETGSKRNMTVEELMSIPAVMNYESIREYARSAEQSLRERAELAKRYGPKHPKMIALEARVSSSQRTLRNEVRNVVGGIERDYETALRSERELSKELERAKVDLQQINRKEFKLTELQREVETNRQLYDMFFQQITETSQAGDFAKAHARVLDPAEYASGSQASKVRAIVIAFVFGLLVAAGIAILLDFIDDTINTPLQVQEKLGAPFLGIVPLVDASKKEEFQHYWEATHSPFAESIRTIRTGVVLDSLDDPAKIIVITSSVPGEGKSTLALNLGAAMGQMEKVLVIGGDLRRPTIAERVHVDKNQPGISNYLSGSEELKNCIVSLADAEIDIMPAGIIPPHPLEMLSSLSFKETLQFLATKYDRIIIDSAPTQAVSDALVLSSYADAVIYVVKAGDTSERLVKQGVERVKEAADGSAVDIVLNYFDNDRAARYSSGGYYYQHYYSSNKSEA